MITAGIIGWPISHFRSPIIHGYGLGRYGIHGRCLKMPVEPRDLPDFIARMHPNAIAGINVTIPHKEPVFSLVSETELMAKRLRAVNTVFYRDGRPGGDNTDGYGFMASLGAAISGWSAGLGAGGGARAIVYTPLRTELLNHAAARGNPIVDGLGMLLHQAQSGFSRRFGIEPEVTPELLALVVADIESHR